MLPLKAGKRCDRGTFSWNTGTVYDEFWNGHPIWMDDEGVFIRGYNTDAQEMLSATCTLSPGVEDRPLPITWPTVGGRLCYR